MSILKSIMHHWNKTTKSYDTLHPETESAQITDWHSGIMASLASKTLGTVVDAITTDSVLGKLIKMLLNASGVKYLIDTNGYICFGEFFGGLIIQWGSAYTEATKGSITFPIAANVKVLCTSDVNQTEVDKMDTARVVTIIRNKLTASSAEYVVNIDDIGSFWWFGIFFN